MRIGILSFSIVTGSGESRFAVNLSNGLIKEGKSVTIFSYSCNFEDAEVVRKHGIEIFVYKDKLNKVDLYRAISDNRKVFSEMLKMIKRTDKCDYYLVLSDALVGIADYKENGKWIYLSNGDLNLLFINQRVLNNYYPYSYILKRRFVSHLMRHQRSVSNYDYLLANCQFTRILISFLLNANFIDYVYPPVDTEFFKPIVNNSKENYALAMLRNNSEPMYETIRQLAKDVPIKIVGNASVSGAVSLGRISDDKLVEAYANASVTIGSSKQEFFGYATAESLACGTPVIAFDHGGSVEMIENNQNGWLVKNETEMLRRLHEIFNQGYEKKIRDNARKSSSRFSITESTNKLINILQ